MLWMDPKVSTSALSGRKMICQQRPCTGDAVVHAHCWARALMMAAVANDTCKFCGGGLMGEQWSLFSFPLLVDAVSLVLKRFRRSLHEQCVVELKARVRHTADDGRACGASDQQRQMRALATMNREAGRG